MLTYMTCLLFSYYILTEIILYYIGLKLRWLQTAIRLLFYRCHARAQVRAPSMPWVPFLRCLRRLATRLNLSITTRQHAMVRTYSAGGQIWKMFWLTPSSSLLKTWSLANRNNNCQLSLNRAQRWLHLIWSKIITSVAISSRRFVAHSCGNSKASSTVKQTSVKECKLTTAISRRTQSWASSNQWLWKVSSASVWCQERAHPSHSLFLAARIELPNPKLMHRLPKSNKSMKDLSSLQQTRQWKLFRT